MMNKIEIKNYDIQGWYIVKNFGSGIFLHKDFIWRRGTDIFANPVYSQTFAAAPGYYPTKAIAQAYLDEYLSRNQIKEEQKMKKGDKVMIEDPSYSMTVMDGRLEHKSYGPMRNSCKDTWVILEMNCKFPPSSTWGGCNDTVIQKISDKTVTFIQVRFLRPATRTIEIDGKKIELSEKSFQNLKRQLN